MTCSACGCPTDFLSMIGPDLLCRGCFGAQLPKLVVFHENGYDEYERYEIRTGSNGKPYRQWHGVPRLMRQEEAKGKP